MRRRFAAAGVLVVLTLVGCRTPMEKAERRVRLQSDPYSGADAYRARCDDDDVWLYVAAIREAGAQGFAWALELKLLSPVERAFTTAHALGGRELPIEPVSSERKDRRKPIIFEGLTGTRPVYTEQYRLPLDEAALDEAERVGIDAMLYGPNGKVRIRCEAELFRVMRKRVDGE